MQVLFCPFQVTHALTGYLLNVDFAQAGACEKGKTNQLPLNHTFQGLVIWVSSLVSLHHSNPWTCSVQTPCSGSHFIDPLVVVVLFLMFSDLHQWLHPELYRSSVFPPGVMMVTQNFLQRAAIPHFREQLYFAPDCSDMTCRL